MTDAEVPETELVTARMANGGEAVGHYDGRVVFVRGALPGERVRVRIVDCSNDRFWRAVVTEVVESSQDRVPPACPAAAHGGGCCDLSFVVPSAARRLKTEVTADVLRRIGSLTDPQLEESGFFADGVQALGPDGEGWRVRTRLFADDQGRTGVHAWHASSVIVGHECSAPVDGLLTGLGELRFRAGSEIVAVAGADGRHIAEIAPPEPVRGSRGDRRHVQRTRRARAASRKISMVEGEELVTHRVGERSWRIGVNGFWQAHRGAPATYARTVIDLAADADAELRDAVAWDLYGGAGIYAGALLDADAADVHVVDSDAGAIDAAKATFAGDRRLLAHRGDVAEVAAGLPAPGVVVLDPPRTGAGRAVIDTIAAAGPRVVVYVACDIGRFARDLGFLTGHGYRLRSLRAFDAFPGTHHVEAVGCLTR
ncbi:TRAM domain-containing protein [Gordonia amarae]|uniref:TRAM domain-containing protein n=2 Tax=Gordonia amarae TaxID=36821 RepID=A0A857KJS8_9ACTN|nr:TRAM domain-containing protein [Gordonia amarae]MCS3878813.1 tRNA/tmRNA/rRNA uracil-C5-methylase (TrmA/RlmC/RlmD family) [Gordonia amarae]QHN17384.1 TRAM domain-containing protein [Gordonia amarae]QHN21910.1 TRAM domain-containing protein [Gordonia amarae]QHN30759.1 TRAM domain-containing protein [Gordonia amarae]QHN39536.1 TRAM domain-containing protein [Gordonia amarae]